MIARFALVLVGLWVLSSCATAGIAQLRRRAAADLSCREESIDGREIADGTFHVWGCSKRATYVETCNVVNNISTGCAWHLDSPVESYGMLAELERQQQAAPQPVAAPRPIAPAPPEDATIETGRAKDGSKQLKLFLRDSAAGWLIYVNVAPSSVDQSALIIWRVPKTQPEQACEIKVVADGLRVEVGAQTTLTTRADSFDYQSTIPYASLSTMAESSRIAARVCDLEAVLTGTQLAKLRELIVRVQEARAWDEQPASSATTVGGS